MNQSYFLLESTTNK